MHCVFHQQLQHNALDDCHWLNQISTACCFVCGCLAGCRALLALSHRMGRICLSLMSFFSYTATIKVRMKQAATGKGTQQTQAAWSEAM
jgi:hypothetical protein